MIHILTSGVVYLIAKRIFPNQWLYAALIAAIFLVHPLQTQAVTYIVQRMASLAALFGFLCLYMYIRAREQINNGVKWSSMRHLCLWSMALITCYLAVKTKENLAILPLAMLLFEYFYLARKNDRTGGIKAKIIYFVPFFLPPLIAAWQRLVTPLSRGVSIQDVASVQEAGITPIQYLVTEFNVMWIYLKLLIIPYPQMLDYAYPVTKTLLSVQNLVAGAGLVALISAAFLVRKRYPHLCFGICWFLLGLAVESTLIPLDPVFEHRVYLSMFGFAVFIVGMGHYFLPKRVLIPLALCCLFIWSSLCWSRNQMWNNELGLYMDNAKHVTPDDGFHIALSKSLITRKFYPEAIEVLTKAVETGAKRVGVHTNLAIAYRLNKQPDKAIEVIITAFNSGIKATELKIELARSYSLAKNDKKALEVYRNALQDGRRIDLITKELGMTLAAMGQFVEAESYLQQAYKNMPNDNQVRTLLAQAKMEKGEMADAEKLLRQVLESEPNNKVAWFKLGLVGHESGDEKTFQKALKRLYKLDGEQAEKLEALAVE
ncbi:MAG: tetratricopeptide repeat protein [Deltaproteobacteria bacterium]|nr:tetratricopeptide repeat protein [Deltaproteobacteria bacterium]